MWWLSTKLLCYLTTHEHQGKDYYDHADELEELLVKYTVYQQAGTKDVTFERIDQTGAEGNYIKATYKDKDGNEVVRYFDYVTAGKDGNPISRQDALIGILGLPNLYAEFHNANKIDHIIIVSWDENVSAKPKDDLGWKISFL